MSIMLLGVAVWLAVGYINFGESLRNKVYWTVEGPVQGLVCEPKRESFAVQGVRFDYSDYDLTPCFHNAATHGGPMRDGLYVRITYIRDPVFGRNGIIRLEVAANVAPSDALLHHP
jgi:hypothetical protein